MTVLGASLVPSNVELERTSHRDKTGTQCAVQSKSVHRQERIAVIAPHIRCQTSCYLLCSPSNKKRMKSLMDFTSNNVSCTIKAEECRGSFKGLSGLLSSPSLGWVNLRRHPWPWYQIYWQLAPRDRPTPAPHPPLQPPTSHPISSCSREPGLCRVVTRPLRPGL